MFMCLLLRVGEITIDVHFDPRKKLNKMPLVAFTRDVRLRDILRYSKSYRK